MSITDLIPASWKFAAFGVAALAAVGTLGGVALAIERHGEAKAAAIYQPKLDAANKAVGALQAANATDEATISAMQDDQRASDLIQQALQDKIDALNQQSDDTASAIRKLQADDKTVDDFLRIPVPDALRSMLNHAIPVGPVGGADTDKAH